MFTWLKNLLGIKTSADTVREVEARTAAAATAVVNEVKAVEAKVAVHPDNPVKLVVKEAETIAAAVVEEVKAVEAVVETKVKAAVEKAKKAKKPRKKKGE